MLFTITGKHIDITDALREHSREKTAKLSKFYNNINQVDVIIDGSENVATSVEIIARAEHRKTFVVTESGGDTYKCIDLAIHKLERQLRKAKEKERSPKHKSGTEGG